MKFIKKVLVANRGEIAIRVMKTCNEMGISTVAVFSDSDKNSLHVKRADEAVHIGNSPPADSYLNIEKIISAAKQTGADAIHPGYGFLSENAAFARRCEEEKIIFIGPSSDSIAKMGSKAGAKEIMKKNGVPVVPGYEGEEQSLKKLISEAVKIGFPVLLKASAGGGGKGMRIVRKQEDLEASIETAKREAKSSFGDDRLILEKYFDSCRHVEIQIFGDKKGNVVHLFERECTIQRRHQKIIEESPSPVLTPGIREKMAEAALKAASAIHYHNAGTVEFILSSSAEEFYFLEVNTRLQVEHPVTEMVTGLDLVKIQIEIAEGKTIPEVLSIDEGKNNSRKGSPVQYDFEKRKEQKYWVYSLEVRLYAENHMDNFLPQTGKILCWKPVETEGVRYDSGIETGTVVDIFYDPLLAKIIAGGKNRTEGIRKMIFALKNSVCLGVTTNKEYLISILENEDFIGGNYNTHFVETHKIKSARVIPDPVFLISSFLFNWHEREKKRILLRNIESGWRNNFYKNQEEKYLIGDKEFTLCYRNSGNNYFTVSCLEKTFSVCFISSESNCVKFNLNGMIITAMVFTAKGGTGNSEVNDIFIHLPASGQLKLKHISNFPEKKSEEISGNYKSPMPGEVIKISVVPGDEVKKGDPLLVILSMKMENTILAHEDGVVEEIFVSEKSFVQSDSLMLKMK